MKIEDRLEKITSIMTRRLSEARGDGTGAEAFGGRRPGLAARRPGVASGGAAGAACKGGGRAA